MRGNIAVGRLTDEGDTHERFCDAKLPYSSHGIALAVSCGDALRGGAV